MPPLPDEAPKPKSKRRRKAEAEEAEKAGKEGAMEETPALDTVEGRRLVRIAVGSVGTLLLLLIGWGIYRTFRGNDGGGSADMDAPAQAAKAVDPLQKDREARYMLDQAKLVAKNGNSKSAVGLLKKLSTTYPQTKPAVEAERQLFRTERGMAPFVEDPPKPAVVVAIKPAPVVTPDVPIRTNPEDQSRRLPAGFRPRPGGGVHPSGWANGAIGERDEEPMVLVPGGSFTMGRNDGPASEIPAHTVALTPYYIDQHEVTVGQYKRFLQDAPLRGIKAPVAPRGIETAADDLPVVRVSQTEALTYARWAKKDLPTEAQWELAARTLDGHLYPAGDEPPTWDKPGASPKKRSPRQVDPVMSFPTDLSPYGAYDLAGNVWEWTLDPYDANGYRHAAVARAAAARHPLLAIRGGSKTWNVTWRTGEKADVRLPYLGFRCVLTVVPPIQAAPPPPPPANQSGTIPF